MLEWKKQTCGTKELLIEGARRIGKSTVAEEFGTNEYKTCGSTLKSSPCLFGMLEVLLADSFRWYVISTKVCWLEVKIVSILFSSKK